MNPSSYILVFFTIRHVFHFEPLPTHHSVLPVKRSHLYQLATVLNWVGVSNQSKNYGVKLYSSPAAHLYSFDSNEQFAQTHFIKYNFIIIMKLYIISLCFSFNHQFFSHETILLNSNRTTISDEILTLINAVTQISNN